MATSFIDYVKIYVASGKGGAGVVHFRREKFVPKGGPDGGNGGDGGSVVLVADPQRSTLLHLKYQRHLRAAHGEAGGGQNKEGAAGKDIIIPVPLGTIVKNEESKEVEKELLLPKERYIIAKGGRGGKGNAFFTRPHHQTPRIAQPGEASQAEWKILELRLLADIGLIGMPNAGKSTLLSVVSAARPIIAPYPFTTLTPQLGMVQYSSAPAFVVADLPGLIAQAALGKGLGIRFLRHIQRSKILAFVVAAEESKAVKDKLILLRKELNDFNPELLKKRKMVVLSKIDLVANITNLVQECKSIFGQDTVVCPVSSIQNRGISILKKSWLQLLQKEHS